MAVSEHPLQHLLGARVPGGTYVVAAHENWLSRDALGARQSATPHPIMSFVGAQRGMGLSVTELFALLECDIADGPVLATSTIDLPRDLQTGTTYEVAGEVTDLQRKQGRTLGTFDLATCRFELTDPRDGVVVASVTNTYAIRRDAS